MNLSAIVNSLVYSFLGVFVLVISFVVIDLLTPGSLWHELLEKQNRALALVAAGAAVAIGLIISSAIH